MKHANQITAEYSEVANDDDFELHATAVAAADVTKPVYCFSVSDKYHHIPEAQNLTWEDDFFEDEQPNDIVAVFDLDYETMERYYSSIGWVCIGLTLSYMPLFALAVLSLAPCYLKTNVKWNVRAKHVAITSDGIRFVEERRPCGWGLSCMDVGKSSKTVPFDQITDCDILEPAGNECFCIPRVLFKVRIDTASSSKENHDLVIAGLQKPHEFKKLVWAMKRAHQRTNSALQNPSAMEMMGPMQAMTESSGTILSSDGDIAALLKEIRDELHQNNEIMKAMHSTPSPAPADDANFI